MCKSYFTTSLLMVKLLTGKNHILCQIDLCCQGLPLYKKIKKIHQLWSYFLRSISGRTGVTRTHTRTHTEPNWATATLNLPQSGSTKQPGVTSLNVMIWKQHFDIYVLLFNEYLCTCSNVRITCYLVTAFMVWFFVRGLVLCYPFVTWCKILQII